MTAAALAVIAMVLLAGAVPAPTIAQASHPGSGHAERQGELDCRNCHQGKHRGVERMYLGVGGRGTPMIPSHMYQVRVQCVACHIATQEDASAAAIVGQTFRPSEQACVGCHGEKFRGMLARWSATLAKMRTIIDPKLASARAALASADGKPPKLARARALVDDAEFNVQFVTLGKGIHNVFYAADLLKLSNTWLGEAMTLLDKTPPKSDDALVRGGYCAVLCHEQAGVKQRDTVTFRKQRVPHVKHVTEFGAVCTACHSAEVHKAVTATAATCRSCHHAPQNERCESCHQAQSALYRGQTTTSLATIEANSMAKAVECTGCHDWSHKRSRLSVREKCLGCHDASYAEVLPQWTTDLDKDARQASDAVARAEKRLAELRRRGHPENDAEASVKQARDALALVRKARGVHNPNAAHAVIDAARQRAEQALKTAHP